MFSNKKPNWIEQLRVKLTEYADERFEDYRGQISEDLSKGLAALAGLIAIWTMAIVCVVFVSITLALLLGWVFTFWMNRFAYVLSFLLMAIIIGLCAYIILKNKEEYIEAPVYKIMSMALRNPEHVTEEEKKSQPSVETTEDWPEIPDLE